MASAADMFAFVTQFGPMMGELAARLDFLEQRVEHLEGGRVATGDPAPGDPAKAGDDESFDFMGEKISLKGMLEGAIPSGGMGGIMDRLKNWKPPAKTATAPETPAAPAGDTKQT